MEIIDHWNSDNWDSAYSKVDEKKVQVYSPLDPIGGCGGRERLEQREGKGRESVHERDRGE